MQLLSSPWIVLDLGSPFLSVSLSVWTFYQRGSTSHHHVVFLMLLRKELSALIFPTVTSNHSNPECLSAVP